MPDTVGPAGLLVPPDRLGVAVERWLDEGVLRDRLRCAARSRRAALTPWTDMAERIARILGLS